MRSGHVKTKSKHCESRFTRVLGKQYCIFLRENYNVPRCVCGGRGYRNMTSKLQRGGIRIGFNYEMGTAFTTGRRLEQWESETTRR
ncbi:hypothetical protein TNCV_1721621 [Trichonephila clavipes]|nr:hypothetical protein TNCV_1721621 [Trichonephila clavipes]